jgi:anthranilate synthase/aminodeoxychorismate synthase-like glutamine amidotransferase
MKILVIDNYDSFTFNLVQQIGKYEPDIEVVRNDKISIPEIRELNPEKIVISPGPGRPEDSQISLDVIKELGSAKSILGVCLGHQAIGYIFGADIINAPILMHGKSSFVKHDGKTIFNNLPESIEAGRYHSLIIDKTTLPECLEISAQTDDGVIMGVRHKQFPIEGIQFHPESILTKNGDQLIKNWLSL